MSDSLRASRAGVGRAPVRPAGPILGLSFALRAVAVPLLISPMLSRDDVCASDANKHALEQSAATASPSGATDATAPVTIKQDSSPPAISVSTPALHAGFKTGQVVHADFECMDSESGVESCIGTVTDGTSIDTGAIGRNDFQVTATDRAGNVQSLTRKYEVVYGRRTCESLASKRWSKARAPVRS